LHYCDYLPFEKDLALDLYIFEFPLPKDDLYKVLLKLACWFWRRRFFKIFSKFLLFCHYLPLGKGVVLHLYNSESSLHKDDLCQLWLKLTKRFWRRSWKCKCLTDRRQTARQTTYKRRSEKLTWAFSSGELKISKLTLPYFWIIVPVIIFPFMEDDLSFYRLEFPSPKNDLYM
jgi:hypothetical protein